MTPVRTISNRSRRTVRDYKRLPARYETMVHWSMIIMSWRLGEPAKLQAGQEVELRTFRFQGSRLPLGPYASSAACDVGGYIAIVAWIAQMREH